MGREKLLFLLLILLDIILTVKCAGYPPIGDEVQAGSVLLPASRRGRYLANIVRRQAVDGTGIKFNKDADRMNADAKKKVDVLSEELLPYIIAEQERRITLYKRIMAAIQNGEKGVTLAEIRNKPPLIIRKGLMYRCPSNRAPKEPDGSGNLICEGDIEPTAVKFDSCLSAEDKDLYMADNKYFFCNRHKVEGPDLPRNGTAVIGCAPIERTSLNYTSAKCALEDTDDVVVHFRYYPDRSYKFVTELDPDHEVCDHWNPCQIGYIFSLPSPDQATLANELWHDYTEKPEGDEIVPAIPEDSYDESFNIRDDEYETSPRRVKIPVGYKYNNVTSGKQSARRSGQLIQIEKIDVQPIEDAFVVVKLLLKKVSDSGSGFAATFYVSFIKSGASDTDKSREIFVKLVRITVGTVRIGFNSLIQMPSEHTQSITIPFDFKKCKLTQIVIRSIDFGIYNLDTSKYKLEDNADSRSKEIRIELDEIKPKDFGYYFAVIENELGHEERYKILSVIPPLPGYEVLKSTRLTISASVGDHVEKTLSYNCEDCTMLSIVCNGENVDTSRISVIPAAKMISFNFPTFEDSNSCVYIGVFNDSHGNIYQQVLAAIDNNSPVVTVESKTVETPKLFKPFEHEVPFSCDDCVVEKVSVNGIPLEMAATRRSASSPMEFYTASQSEITIHITEFTKMFEGVYQAVFSVKGEMITKTILEIRDPKNNNEDSTHNEKDKGEDKSDDKDEDKPTEKPKEKTEEKSEDKNEEKSHDKHEDKIEDKHEENSTKKPEDKSSHDAEEKSTGKPEEKHEENPAENTSEKPAEHIEEKPAENLLLKNQQDKITHNIATATVTTNSLHTQ